MSNGKLIVFTGPSGVGKATLEHQLFSDESLKLKLSVSATTRAPRKGEVDGVHYNFITKEEFNKKIENDEFVEWNTHFENMYGTLKSEVERIMNEGFLPFLEIETNGAENVINKFGKERTLSIFIAPPSLQDLRKRIKERGTETKEQITIRLARAEEEMMHEKNFQYIVVNDDVDRAVQEIKKILKENFHETSN